LKFDVIFRGGITGSLRGGSVASEKHWTRLPSTVQTPPQAVGLRVSTASTQTVGQLAHEFHAKRGCRYGVEPARST